MPHDSYVSVLSGRYPSKEMKSIWSDDTKFQTWRQLWVELARAQLKLGLDVTADQVAQMEAQVKNIDYEMAAKKEKELRHDVMAHIHTFGHVAPLARPIIHFGATSCYVTDNTELIQMKNSLQLVCERLARVIARLRKFAMDHRHLPVLGFTHLQPAQPVTLGKRATLWLHDLVMDLQEFERVRDTLKFRGVKGTVGTQASFLEMFKGDHSKVQELDRLVTEAFGFREKFIITGQTYTRKQDSRVIFVLADFGSSVCKMGMDLRLLQSRKEVEEPFEKNQVGSTAMAYKRNPMRAERMCALGRRVMNEVNNPLQTHAAQCFERTLDDSAARRFYLPESFLLADSLLLIAHNVFENLVVYPAVIARNLRAELPFMATEEIILAMVASGGDRQDCHERIRVHSQAASDRVKMEGADNDLMERLGQDEYFEPIHAKLSELVNPSRFIGRAPDLVEEFDEVVTLALAPYADQLEGNIELSV